jgi:hypothetical protein
MTSVGIQAFMLSVAGVHSALTHHELIRMIEITRILGNSYRLASSGPGSSLLYGRLAVNFCRAAVVAGVAR